MLPRPPEAHAALRHAARPRRSRTLNAWAGQPLPLNASVWWRGTLAVRLRGAVAAVAARSAASAARRRSRTPRRRVLGRPARPARRVLRRGRARRSNARARAVAAVAAGDHAGAALDDTLVEWGGAQRWICATTPPAAQLRELALAGGGHVPDAVPLLPRPQRRRVRAAEGAARPHPPRAEGGVRPGHVSTTARSETVMLDYYRRRAAAGTTTARAPGRLAIRRGGGGGGRFAPLCYCSR